MNKNLWSVLNSYGCIPNKSLVLQFPKESIFKDKSLIRHFIRGYFDGDGCITYHKFIHCVTPAISVLGTKDFLDKIIQYSNITSKFRHDDRHSEQTFSLEYNKENGIKLINWLYSDCTIYLDRKYNLFNFFKNGSRSIQE
jgi:intein/homing endonuclease